MDPLDLVTDLRDPRELARAYAYPYEESLIRLTDEAVRDWERDALLRVRNAIEHREGSPGTDWLRYLLDTPEPVGSYPVPGFAEIEGWDTLTRSRVWEAVVRSEGGGRVDAPTTLGRIEAGLARRIVARAYLNTFLVSLYLTPLGQNDLAQLESLPGRLDLIVPGSAAVA